MARSGLSKFEVKEARDLLVSQGRHPSVDAIRITLGNTGSKTTIHRYLKELEKEDGKADDRQAEIAKTLHDLVEQLAARLHADTNARIETLEAAHELALQRKTEEMEVLQERIDMLSVRLREVEMAHDANPAYDMHSEDARRQSAAQFSAGFFGTLLNTSRNGGHDHSLFSALLNGSRSAIIVPREIQPAMA